MHKGWLWKDNETVKKDTGHLTHFIFKETGLTACFLYTEKAISLRIRGFELLCVLKGSRVSFLECKG